MNLHVLIADARPLFRKVLHEVFAADVDVAFITEAATSEELIKQLRVSSIDFVLAHQSLISDISLLPLNRFALIARVPDKTILLAAWERGIRGYLMEASSEELLRRVLHSDSEQPVIDPILTSWFVELLAERELSSGTGIILTPREREVLALKKQHLSNYEIAQKLNIEVSTVKSHIRRIRRTIPGITW